MRSQSTKRFLAIFALAFGIRLLAFVVGVPASQMMGGPEIPFAENFKDYYFAYIPSVKAFLEGRMLYRDFYHAYPPLFIYVLSLLYAVGQSWFAPAIPLMLGDLLTIVPIYLIAKKLFNENRAVLATFAFAVCPVNVYYLDYLWLNPSLTTLFLMVSVYLFLMKRTNLSALSLAISTGFKQTSLLAAPIMIVELARTGNKRKAATFFAIYLIAFILISLPYIAVTPVRYLWCLRVPLLDPGSLSEEYWTIGFAPPPSTVPPFDPSTLSTLSQKMLKFVSLNAPMKLHLLILMLAPFELDENTAKGIYSTAGNVLLVLLAAGYLALLFWLYRSKRPNGNVVVQSLAIGQLLFFGMYGLYKYYFAGVTPLLAALIPNWMGLFIFMAFNVVLIFVPRILSPYLVLGGALFLAAYGLVKGKL